MDWIRVIKGIGPKVTKDHPTDIDNSSDDEGTLAAGGIIRWNYLLREVRVYTLGSATEEIRRPVITSTDCFWILVALHLNLRFITQYVDLSLEWGGLWIIYSLTNATLCAWFALIFTFLGSYGDRSFLKVWHMMPMFSGISFCVVIIEAYKMVETSVILSSGFMYFTDYLAYGAPENSQFTPLICNRTSFKFKPAFAVPYGVSETFTKYGYKSNGNNVGEWTVNSRRVKWMVFVYFMVNLIRLLQFKRYRFYPLRFNTIALLCLIGSLIVMTIMVNANAVGEIIQYQVSQYTNVQAYLQIIMMAVAEYLPMHWVTIGYLCPKHALMSKIWIISALKILISFFLLFWLPYVAGDFQEFTKVTSSNCLNFFGIHFLFVMIPISLKKYFMTETLYIFYFLLIIIHGLTNILISIELFCYSFMTSQRMMYRYRNIIYLLVVLILLFISYPFCIETAHYLMFFLTSKMHFFSNMVIMSLSTLSLALYGLDRINGDHLFMKGVIFPYIPALKILFLINSVLLLLFVSQAYFYNYRREDNHYNYWVLVIVAVAPVFYGFWHTVAFRGKLHGMCQPKTSWGMPSAQIRNQRRRKTIHTMYSYRMKRDCAHNCLIDHPKLQESIEVNLTRQEVALKRKRTKLRLAIDRQSRQSI